MKILSIVLIVFIFCNCGMPKRESVYIPGLNNVLTVQFVQNHGTWSGPDGFPVTGYQILVEGKGLKGLKKYGLKNKWHKPENIFLARGDAETGFCIKWYNILDFYKDDNCKTILSLDDNERIADVFVDHDNVYCHCRVVEDKREWGHLTMTTATRIIKINIVDDEIQTILSVNNAKPMPFLQAMHGKLDYYSGFININKLAIINDGQWIYLINLVTKERRNIHKISGEIWECRVDDGNIFIEDRVMNDNISQSKNIVYKIY